MGLAAAGCSVDRIEWESSGFPVEEVEHVLREEHHVEPEGLECIKREVGGALWECRAHAEGAEWECEVHVGVRERIRKLHCESKEEEEHTATIEQPQEQATNDEHAG
jgi:hypothetical protein